MPDENKRKERQYLEYDAGKIKDVEIPAIGEPPEDIDKFIEEDKDLAPISDMLKGIDNEIKELEEKGEINHEMAPKVRKKYIDISEHKHVDSEDGQSDNWLDVKNENDKEEKSAKSKPKKEKKPIKISFKITPYYVVVSAMAIAMVFFLYGNREATVVQRPKETANVSTSQTVQSSDKIDVSKLKELSNLALEYTHAVETMESLRASEIKVSSGYIDGSYTKEQLNTAASQSAGQKEALLTAFEKESVSSEFKTLNTLAQRVVRAELNASKRILRDIETSQKPSDIYTTFAGTTSVINDHIKSLSDELEALLIKYNIAYSRSGNKFTF